MKSFSTITLFLMAFSHIFTQTTFYTQNFDGVTIPTLPTNWSSSSTTTQTMSNTASDYSGASGAQNLFMANCQPNSKTEQ